MKRIKKHGLFIAVFSAFLTACANDYKQEMAKTFKGSIEANRSSESHIEWEVSSDNSVKIFENLRANYAKTEEGKKKSFQQAVCWGLLELSHSSIMVFQDEIHRIENKDVIGSVCQVKLTALVADQSAQQTVDFKYRLNPVTLRLDQPLDFKVDSRVVELDRMMTTQEMISQLSDGEIAITFDDGPDGQVTDSILETLKAAGHVKVMFFTKGASVEATPQPVLNEFRDGHIVANHSWNHLCLKDSDACAKNNAIVGKGMLTDDEVMLEIVPSFDLIKKTVGVAEPFFRYPYGEARESTSRYLKENNVYEVGWNMDSNDWKKIESLGISVKHEDPEKAVTKETFPYTAQDVIESSLRQVKARKKGIILFHDVHIRTAEILPQFLYELSKLNYKVVQFKTKAADVMD